MRSPLEQDLLDAAALGTSDAVALTRRHAPVRGTRFPEGQRAAPAARELAVTEMFLALDMEASWFDR